MTYGSSGDQIFAKVARLRARAQALLAGPGPAAGEAPSRGDLALDEEERREAAALAAGVELRLPRLQRTFGLSALGAEVIACLVAVELDPFMRTLVRAVQREIGRPWIELGTIAELLELPTERVPELGALFAEGGPLRRFGLALLDETLDAPAVAQRVRLPGRVARHLVGEDQLPPGLSLRAPRDLLSRSLVDASVRRTALARLGAALDRGEGLVVEITGAPGVGRRFLAEGLAHALARPLLLCDLQRADRASLQERLGEARREARLAGALLCLAGWDALLPSATPASDEADAGPRPAAPRRLPAPLAELLESLDAPLLLTAEEREPLLERHARAVLPVEVPFPSPSQRADLLREALHSVGAAPEPGVDLVALARRFALDPSRLELAARAALELGREHQPGQAGPLRLGFAELAEACRRQLRHDLKSLAARVTDSHRWEDLVIPVDVYHGLREMIAYVQHGHRVYDEWGFGARHSLSQGVSALFAGPPGTGKTMCASVMARELDMELFRVDLSRIVSKWIGETEKNLAKVFDEAQRSNAIILFDEADSLFARRTEVKSSVDRYANLEVNFLLQRMEAFGGVTILTTNFEDTIDTAFKRRLTFRLRFEKPDAEARAALWRKVFPASCALAPDVDFERVAELHEMSGGNIRNAAVRAAFLAAADGRAIDQAALLLAAERESREMGLLTRTGARGDGRPPSIDAPASPSIDAGTDGPSGRSAPGPDRGGEGPAAARGSRLLPLRPPRPAGE